MRAPIYPSPSPVPHFLTGAKRREMTRLSPIYVCDALSFLPYSQLQQSRLVSRSLNNTIVGQPARLQARRCFTYLEVDVWDAGESGRCVGEDGHWTNSKVESHAENWKHLQEQWGCCNELKVVSGDFLRNHPPPPPDNTKSLRL
jgi:hypothetical protein